jgi:hypothetical protein
VKIFGELEQLNRLTVRSAAGYARGKRPERFLPAGALPVSLDQAKESFAQMRRERQ